MKVCPACAERIEQGKFCPRCGTPLTETPANDVLPGAEPGDGSFGPPTNVTTQEDQAEGTVPRQSFRRPLLITLVAVVVVALGVGAAFAVPGLLGGGPVPPAQTQQAKTPAPSAPTAVSAELTVEGTIPGSDLALWDALRQRTVGEGYIDAVATLIADNSDNASYSFTIRVVEADGDPQTVESLVEVEYEMSNDAWLVYESGGQPATLELGMNVEGTWTGAYTAPDTPDPTVMAFVKPGVGEGEALYLPALSKVVFSGGEATLQPVFHMRTDLTSGQGWQDNAAIADMRSHMSGDWWEYFTQDDPSGYLKHFPASLKSHVRGYHNDQQLGFDDYITQSMGYIATLSQQTLAETTSEPAFTEGEESTPEKIRSFVSDFFGRPLNLPVAQPAQTTPPSGAPSCPAGMSPLSWTAYEGGSILLCSTGGKVSVVYSDTTGTARPQPTSVRFVVGGYVLGLAGGGSVSVDGGTVRTSDAAGASTDAPASVAWTYGQGDAAVPDGQPSCPAGSWQIARTVWNDGWMLICGTDQGTPTRIEYSDARTGSGSSGEVTGGDGVYCGKINGVRACTYRDGDATIGDESRTVTQQDWAGPAAPQFTRDNPRLTPGRWVTVLESLNKKKVMLAQAHTRAQKLGNQWGVSVYVFDSTATPGMNPGYWALTLISFDSNAQARAACSWVGRSPGDTCYGRKITG